MEQKHYLRLRCRRLHIDIEPRRLDVALAALFDADLPGPVLIDADVEDIEQAVVGAG